MVVVAVVVMVAVVLTVEMLVVAEVNVVRIVTKRVVDLWSVSYDVTVTGCVIVTDLVSVTVSTLVLVTVTGFRTEPLKKPANKPATSRIAGNTFTGFITIVALLRKLSVSKTAYRVCQLCVSIFLYSSA